MGGGDRPDNSAQVAQIEAQAAREAREAETARKAQEMEQFNTRLNSAFGTGVQDASDYFASQGLDPDQYAGKIRSRASTTRGSVPIGDANPASYFADLGQQIFDTEQGAERNRDMRGIDTFAPAGFESKRIGDTLDDDLIASLLEESMVSPRDYIGNLMDRGVITASGREAAMKNLDSQKAGAKSRLSEITSGLINEGRSGATSRVADLRSRASNQRLGDNFDPFAEQGGLEEYFKNFFSGFGENVRGKLPTDLFSTSGLAGIAGAGQGAQNTQFNPNALAGIFGDDEEEDEDELNPF